MKQNHWLVVVAIAWPIVGCTSKFHTCEARRACPAGGSSASDAGSAGDGGSDPTDGGTSGAAGADTNSGGTSGDDGSTRDAGGGDALGEAGDAGGPPTTVCDRGYSACSGGCIFTDGDPKNCGGCNLKCPTGSLCKSSMCEVRIGYPNRFTGGEDSPFRPTTGQVTAIPITVTRQSMLLALGYINQSTTVGAVATFGLYADSGMKSPGSLAVPPVEVSLRSSAQEVAVSNIVLVPGTYYFAILTRDGESMIYVFSNVSLTVDLWIGGFASYAGGLPSSFGSLAFQIFSVPLINLYLVVRQSGS